MLPRIGTFLLLIIVVSSASAAFQQPEPKGIIEGTVLSAATGAPIPNARVFVDTWFENINSIPLYERPLPQNPNAVAAIDGRFSINVRPGSYRVFAEADGYVRQEYGQKIPNTNGARVNVTAGAVTTDLTIRMPQSGVLTGRIFDEARQPAVGVPVQLLRTVYDDGRRMLRPVGTTTSNDLGEYRLFGVTPGRYHLAAGTGPEAFLLGMLTGRDENSSKYEFAFYPGVPDLAQAALVEVKSGSELSLDLSPRAVHSYRIRGRIIDASTGQPPSNPDVLVSFSPLILSGITWNGIAPPLNYDTTDGAFELPRITPGIYRFEARARRPAPSRPGPAAINSLRDREAAAAAIPMGQAIVNVADSDIDNVQIVISAPATLQARIQREGQQIPAHFQFKVLLKPVVGASSDSPAEPEIEGDGLFSLPNVHTGEYRVEVTGMVYGFYVKSMRYAGVDVLGKTMNFSATNPATLEILVQRAESEVRGVVTDAAQGAVPRAEVVLVPEDRTRADLFVSWQANASGNFTIENVPPGRYKAFSWEAFEPLAYYDPEFIRRYEQQGRTVIVRESANAAVDLTMIPAEP